MRKPRENSVAKTINYCLARADNTSPFRWMGVWCAVYAPSLANEGGLKGRKTPCPRSIRRHRGTKRRGRGSARKIKLAARMACETNFASLDTIPPHITRAKRTIDRIGYMDERFAKYARNLVDRINQANDKIQSMVRRIDELQHVNCYGRRVKHSLVSKTRLKPIRLVCWSNMRLRSSLQERLIGLAIGHWGLPRDLAVRRLLMWHRLKCFKNNAIPRDVRWEERLSAAEAEKARLFENSVRTQALRATNKVRRCSCKRCKYSTICKSCEQALDSTALSCWECGWVRH